MFGRRTRERSVGDQYGTNTASNKTPRTNTETSSYTDTVSLTFSLEGGDTDCTLLIYFIFCLIPTQAHGKEFNLCSLPPCHCSLHLFCLPVSVSLFLSLSVCLPVCLSPSLPPSLPFSLFHSLTIFCCFFLLVFCFGPVYRIDCINQ